MKMHLVKFLVLNVGWILGSCAPLFSDMQSARLVGKRKFEVTPGYSSVEPLVAFNIGMALSSDISKWAIRPEYGVLSNLNAKGHFSNFSLGVTLNLSTISKR